MIDALLYPVIVSELHVQRMLCWIVEEGEEEEEEEKEEGREERWKEEFVRVRVVESSMHITPSRVSLNVLSLTSALHPLIRIREAFQLHIHSVSPMESVVYERDSDEEGERREVVLIEH